MSNAKLKTKKTPQPVNEFIDTIEHEKKRADAKRLLALFNEVTQLAPVMWSNSIVGYGRYQYRYESGREGEFFMTGFSPRKANFSIHILPGYQDLSEYLAQLGKHKTGKSCLYINKLDDVDQAVLKKIIRHGLEYMKANYKTFDQ